MQARNPMLERLDVFVGEWEIDVSVGDQHVARGRTVIDWLDGAAFLVEHQEGELTDEAPAEWRENAPAAVSTITGLDDSAGVFTRLYADTRGVTRVYQMTLVGGLWKVWRDSPGFNQRFAGTFGQDGKTIAGRWETSLNGSNWAYDFDLTYTKIR